MPRYLITVMYRGDFFGGWQIQPNRITPQGLLTQRLTLLNKGQSVTVTGAGRTDAGVHSWGQKASFMMTESWKPSKLMLAINAGLPEGLRVRLIKEVDLDFDARKDALWRSYRYYIWQGASCPIHLEPYVWWYKQRPWDLAKVEALWRQYEGRHNFSAFCKTGELPSNPMRTMYSLQVKKKGDLWCLAVTGQSFLMHMVRTMVGTVAAVMEGQRDDQLLGRLLEGGSRPEAGQNAPASGLHFWRVGYGPKGGYNKKT